MVANFVFVSTGAGLVATPSPGSIFAELAMTPRGGVLPVLSGIGAGAVTTCLAAIPLVRSAGAGETAAELGEAREKTRRLKRASRPALASGPIVFACDAGMGSSVIGAAMLQRKLREAGIDAKVAHAAIAELPSDAACIVVHESLAERARLARPGAPVYAVDDFIQSPVYDAIVNTLRESRAPEQRV